MRRLALLVLLTFCIGCGGSPPTVGPAPIPPPPMPDPGTLVVPPAPAGKVAPDRITVTATSSAGEPLPDTPYRWTTDRHSGWVFPAEGRTDDEGKASATWIPGIRGAGTLLLTFSDGGEERTQEYQTFSTWSENPPSSAIGVQAPIYQEASGLSMDVTPLTDAARTFYMALTWQGGYAGIQAVGSKYLRQLQFSLWVAEGEWPEARDLGDGVQCVGFAHERSGVKCEAEFPWSVGDTFRFQLTEELVDGVSDLSLEVTNLANGERRYIGTIRYGQKAQLKRMGLFVEDFERSAASCLDQPVRAAAYRRAMFRNSDGTWVPVVDAFLAPHTEDAANPGTPPCWNFDAREHPDGLEVVMGGLNVRDPDALLWVTIPR